MSNENKLNPDMGKELFNMLSQMNKAISMLITPQTQQPPVVEQAPTPQPPATTPPPEATDVVRAWSDVRDLAFNTGYADLFAKEAKKKWPEYTHAVAAEAYKKARGEMITEGKWKLRPSNPRRMNAGKVTTIPPTAEQPPVVPPAAPANVPVAQTDGLLDLATVEAEAKSRVQNDVIDAIKYIRMKTGWGLLESKLWTDYLRGFVKEEPIQVITAKAEYQRRLLINSKPTLDQQVQQFRQNIIDKEMNAEAGQAEKQKKMDLAMDNKSMLVQVARRIARDLAVNGPITIDDVTAEMAKRYNVLPSTGKRQAWKGSVFTKTEWAYIGEMPSRQKSAHGRPVGMWAQKTWLKDNTLNGKSTSVSSFVLSRLLKDFEHKYGNVDLTKCNCYLGEDKLAAEIQTTVVKDGNKYCGVPVTFVPGAIGAMITMPGVSPVGFAMAGK